MESEDDSHPIAKLVSARDGNMYGNDEIRSAIKPLLPVSSSSSPRSASAAAATEISSVTTPASAVVGISTIQKIQAQQIMALPTRVREQALADLHGTNVYPSEDPEFNVRCLDQMEQHLSKLPKDETTAYRLSLSIDPDYASDHVFRLMFLRADSYDPQAAANRLALHFALKLELFGKSMLTKTITVKDLDDDTRDFVRSGNLEPLPMRDRAGRQILFGRAFLLPKSTMMKAQWFVWMSMVLGDDVTQIRGIVIAGYNIGSNFIIDCDGWRNASFCMRSLPVRIAAHHSLVHGNVNASIVLAARYFMLPANRVRFQPHFDKSVQDYNRDLRSFGLPMESFVKPGRSEETMVERTQMRFLAQQIYLMNYKNAINQQREQQKQREQYQEQQSAVVVSDRVYSSTISDRVESSIQINEDLYASQVLIKVIDAAEALRQLGRNASLELANAVNTRASENRGSNRARSGATGSTNEDRIHGLRQNDVVFGKGQSREYHGNLRVQKKVQELAPEYHAGGRSRKTELAKAVVEYINDTGGRFLKYAEDDIDDMSSSNIGGYVEVPNVMAREKITRFFRKFKSRK